MWIVPIALIAVVVATVAFATRKTDAREERRPLQGSLVAGIDEVCDSVPDDVLDEAIAWSKDRGLLSSPISGVDAKRWTDFVRSMMGEKKGRVGAFAFSIRRLADLGVVKLTPNGAAIESWNDPAFQSSIERQYAAFKRSVADHFAEIEQIASSALADDGAAIDGVKPTASGLLAVAHFAGPGLPSWLANERDRVKFSATTDAFKRSNGIF